jgi:hypothetical protein
MKCSICNTEGHKKTNKKFHPAPSSETKIDINIKPSVTSEMSLYTYEQTRKAIIEAAMKTNIEFTVADQEDGRLSSAIKEKPYLKKLIEALPPDFVCDLPKVRYWYDIRINGIPINLKLTTGKTDNAFNKKAIETALTCGELTTTQNSNYNEFYANLKKCAKNGRNLPSEYHYLVIDKNAGKILLKPILDIHTYKTNPSNIMQIDWKKEFLNITYTCPDFKAKIRELIKTIQTSLREWEERSRDFRNADIDADFA